MHGRAFAVGEDIEVSLLKQLASHFYSDIDVEVLTTNSKNKPIKNASTPTSLLFLGHASTEEYGEFTAKEFAKKVAEIFNKTERSAIKDIYLVGCEIGLIDDNTSLTQKITDSLYRQGFRHVKVHAITKEKESSDQAMYVEVISHTGLRVPLDDKQPGYINAYILSNHFLEFNELLKNPKHNHRRIQEIKEEAFKFVDASHPVTELNKPHNTFIPNETPSARQKRIENDLMTKLSKQQKRAIDILIKRRDYEVAKKKKNVSDKLDMLIKHLNRAESKDWQRMINDFKKHFNYFVTKSNTLKLLEHLSDEDFDAADQMIAEQNNNKKLYTVKTRKKFVSNFFTSKNEVKGMLRPLLEERDEGKIKVEKSYPNKDQSFMEKIQQEITDLITELTMEIHDLKSGCFSCFNFFTHFEVQTKTQKKAALQNLLNQSTVSEMKATASQFQQNARVMRSQKTNRTANLINKIAAQNSRQENREKAAAVKEKYRRRGHIN